MEVTATRALIFYGDITGFTTWSRRVRRERVGDLLRETYGIYDRWEAKTGYWTKKQADGLIGAIDLQPKNDQEKIIRALRWIYELSAEVNRYLEAQVYPRTKLFRVRQVIGDAWRLDKLGKGSRDYAGDPMDFGRRLLDVAKEERIIVSEGIFDGVGRSCRHIAWRELNLGELNLLGVHPDDQKRFWSYRFKTK